MAILDQYGSPIYRQRNFSHGSERDSTMRPWQPTRLDDIDKLIPSYDRRTLVSVSRMIVENFGPIKGAIREIAMWSTMDAWIPKNASTSDRWRKKAESVIREEFCPIADLRGAGRSFVDVMYHASVLLDRDGEVFVLLTERDGGFPAIQVIPSHRIGDGMTIGESKVSDGPYKGLPINDGVISNAQGTVVAYRFINDDKLSWQDISARSMIHCFESDYPESKRGYPSITHGLNDIRDSMQSHEWERLNMLIRSSIALVESNESGTPDDSMPGAYFTDTDGNDCPARGIETRYLDGGAVKHFRAGTGSKIELVKHENPGTMWSDYNDRMIKSTCSGIPWPVSMIGFATGQGTAERKEIEIARRTIKDRQSTLRTLARRIIGYATQKMKKLGRIGESPDWWRWSFTMPPVLTIDDGRISKAMMELWRAGVISDEDMLIDLGKDPEGYWPRKFEMAADKEIAFEETQSRKGVKLDKRYKGMFTANDMGEEAAKAETKTTDNEDDPTDD